MGVFYTIENQKFNINRVFTHNTQNIMKKLILSSAVALLGASAVFAQGYSVEPSKPNWNDTYKDTQNGTVTFTFDKSVILDKDEIMAVGLNGWGFEMNFLQLDFDVVSNDEVNSLVVKVDRASWGDPALSDSGEMDENGNYATDFHLTVLLQGIYDADGNMIGEDEDWGGPSASYYCPNTFDAYFLHTAPSSEYFSAEMAYDNEVIAFCFSNQITLKNETAKVSLKYEGLPYNSLNISNIACCQDEYTGVWKVLVPVEFTDIVKDPSELSYMSISLSGVYNVNGEEIVIPTAIFTEDPEGVYDTYSIKKVNTASRLNINEQSEQIVYDIYGTRIDSNNASNLPKGIYIVNGQKVLVR